MGAAPVNVLQRVYRSLAITDSRATRGSTGPGVRRGEVHGPEGPRPALHGAYGIYAAGGLAVGSFQKNAVIIGALNQAVGTLDFPHVLAREIIKLHIEKICNPRHIFQCKPDVSRTATAAIAALRTFKAQSHGIPWIGRMRFLMNW